MTGPLAQWEFFWGCGPIHGPARALLVTPLALDLLGLLAAGAAYMARERPGLPVTISQVLAHEPSKRVGDAVTRASPPLWLLLFAVRRPVGMGIAFAAVLLAGFGLQRFPVPPRGSAAPPGRWARHFFFAVLEFVAFGATLVSAHGLHGWPILPFAVAALSSGACAVFGARILRPAAAASVTAVAEWAGMAVFYVALMLPPARPQE